MPQRRKYANNAEKQRAFRERQAAHLELQRVRRAEEAPRPLDSLDASQPSQETPPEVKADMAARRVIMDAIGL